MIYVNELYKLESISRVCVENLILLLSPFAPHISEEIWQRLGNKESIAFVPWPDYIEKYVKEENVTVVFQVNGKIRAKQDFKFDSDEHDLEDGALYNENVKKFILGKQIIKIVTVKNKMVNIVVK